MPSFGLSQFRMEWTEKEIWMDGMDKSEELKEIFGIRGRGTDTRIWMCT